MKNQFLINAAFAMLLTGACKQSIRTASLIKHTDKANQTKTITLTDYNITTITSVTDGEFIQVSGDFLLNQKYNNYRGIEGAQLSSSNLLQDAWQKWHIIYKTTESGVKYYHIRNVFSGKLLEVPDAALLQGIQVQQNSESSELAAHQLWKLVEVDGNGQYYIISKGNGLALTNKDASSEIIVQEKYTNADKQKWMINIINPESYRDDHVVGFFNRNGKTQGSAAFDQGNSIPLTYGSNKGKVLWITQDAWDGSQLQVNNKFNCKAFHIYSNSVLIQPSKTDWNPANTPNITIPNSTSGKPKQVFNISPGTSWTWSGIGVEIADKVYVHCGEGNDLSTTNQSLYVLTQNTSGLEWSAKRTTPEGMSGQTAILYVTGMVKQPNGYVYAFGSQGMNAGYNSNVYVARFLQSDPQSWTFWNGSSWESSPVTGKEARVADGLGTCAVSYLNGKYILMTMDQGFNCNDSRNIYISTSSSPTGPFTTKQQVYTIKEYLKSKYVRYYTPIIHPTFDNGKNELLLTYCLNFSGCNVEPCENGYLDPYYYRVKAIRVPYSLIGL